MRRCRCSRRRPSTSEPVAGRRGRKPAQDTPDGGPPSDPETRARDICLRQLTGAPRTRAQLADTLRRRGIDDDVAEAVLDRLVDVRLVDDAAYAQAWVRSRHTGRGLARRALAHELRARGVDDGHVSNALAGLDHDEERATARALVERRLRAMTGLPHETRVRRLAGMLARKGYPPGLAAQVVRDAVGADADADPSAFA